MLRDKEKDRGEQNEAQPEIFCFQAEDSAMNTFHTITRKAKDYEPRGIKLRPQYTRNNS